MTGCAPDAVLIFGLELSMTSPEFPSPEFPSACTTAKRTCPAPTTIPLPTARRSSLSWRSYGRSTRPSVRTRAGSRYMSRRTPGMKWITRTSRRSSPPDWVLPRALAVAQGYLSSVDYCAKTGGTDKLVCRCLFVELDHSTGSGTNTLASPQILEIGWEWQRQAQLGDGSIRGGQEPSPRPSALRLPPRVAEFQRGLGATPGAELSITSRLPGEKRPGNRPNGFVYLAAAGLVR